MEYIGYNQKKYKVGEYNYAITIFKHINEMALNKDSFKKADNRRIGLTPQMYEVNKLEAIDIDDSEDFQLAELLYKHMRKST